MEDNVQPLDIKDPVPFSADFCVENFYELSKSEEVANETIAEGNRVVEGYASTGDLDAQRHIITDDAIKQGASSLGEYRTVLFNHDPNRPIGKLVDAQARDNRLWIKVVVSKSEPLLWEKIKDGTLSKFSVKGKILQADKEFGKSDDGSPDPSKEILIIKSMELYEVSLVSVPANAKARSLIWYIEKALTDIKPTNPTEEEQASAETSDKVSEDLDALKAQYPWLEDVIKSIDEEDATIDIEDLPEITESYVTLEKWVEEHIPIDIPLENFELVKDLAVEYITELAENSECPLVKAKDMGPGRWITYAGRKIFIAAKKGAQHTAVGAAAVGAGAVGAVTGAFSPIGAYYGYKHGKAVGERKAARRNLKGAGKREQVANSAAARAIAGFGLPGYGPYAGARHLGGKAARATARAVGLKKSEPELIQVPLINLIAEEVPFILELAQTIDPDNNVVIDMLDSTSLEDVPQDTITLEKWVEDRLPINIPLENFEATRDTITALIDEALVMKGILASSGEKIGRWVTIKGAHVFIEAKDIHEAKLIRTPITSRVSEKLEALEEQSIKKDSDSATDDVLLDNIESDEYIDTIFNTVEKELKGGELFVDLNKDMINLDKAMEALAAASQSGEFKGEDLDQLTAAVNAVKALRVRVYGSDTKSTTKKSEETPTEAVVEKSMSDTDALTSVISQLQEVAKGVTAQAQSVASQVAEIEKMKAEVVKAVEGMTSIVAKIPIRNAQTPEAENSDRVEKSLITKAAERAGGEDNFKKMHPGAKLRLMFDTKMNGLNK